MCNIYVSRLKELSKNTLQSTYQNNTKVCLTALDEIIKRAFEILETSDDNREKLQAMELFKDTHLVKLELLSNATTIDSALNYIKSKQQQQQKKHLSLDSTSDDNNNSDDNDHLTATSGRQIIF
ncbi:MAG: hypothetical protein ACJ72V_10265 [Nitrososphaeraceae archaeon]|jgi:hypothetical protein